MAKMMNHRFVRRTLRIAALWDARGANRIQRYPAHTRTGSNVTDEPRRQETHIIWKESTMHRRASWPSSSNEKTGKRLLWRGSFTPGPATLQTKMDSGERVLILQACVPQIPEWKQKLRVRLEDL